MRLHTNIFSILRDPSSWAGFAGVLTSFGSQLDKPYSVICYAASALCSVIAILITPSPSAKE